MGRMKEMDSPSGTPSASAIQRNVKVFADSADNLRLIDESPPLRFTIEVMTTTLCAIHYGWLQILSSTYLTSCTNNPLHL